VLEIEVEVGLSQADIKRAYRDLAKVWHPDRFSGDSTLQQKAQEKLKRINAAIDSAISTDRI
jgi:curved DNA-binding protein CbpA